MALESVFLELGQRLERLAQALENLQWAVVEGQPAESPGHSLVDFYENGGTDLRGLLREATEAIALLPRTAARQWNAADAYQALSGCDERISRIFGRFYGELAAFQWTDSLHQLAHEKRKAWAHWVQGVKDALSQCSEALCAVQAILLPCWRELVGRSGPSLLASANVTGANFYFTKD